MKEDRLFVDTNVLVYAYDETAAEKHDQAKEIVQGLWETRNGILSMQVLQEFFITLWRSETHSNDHTPSCCGVIHILKLIRSLFFPFWKR